MCIKINVACLFDPSCTLIDCIKILRLLKLQKIAFMEMPNTFFFRNFVAVDAHDSISNTK